MPVKFEDNFLRPEEPQVCFPGRMPWGDFHETGARFPIDSVTQKLVEVVGRKGWDLPDIEVEFDTYGSDDAPLMVVRSISGGTATKKWRIRYSRPEFSNDQWNVTTAVSTVNIPQQEFSLYSDNSGPTLYCYVGDDWFEDEDRFMKSTKIHSKLNGEDRWYLQYKGQGNMMVADSDLGRQYMPMSYEQSLRSDRNVLEREAIPKSEMFFTAETFLKNVIADIEAKYPDHKVDPITRIKDLSKIEDVPLNKDVPSLIVMQKRYSSKNSSIVSGTGRRLVSLDIKNDQKNSFPEKAYDGFSYGFPNYPYQAEFSYLSDSPRDMNTRIVKVDLLKANDIYVVDEDVYYEAKIHYSAKANYEDRGRLTREEVNAVQTLFAQTMVSLNDYDGSYKKPIYLINRPLMSDEAKDITDLVREQNPEDRWNPKVDFSSVMKLS